MEIIDGLFELLEKARDDKKLREKILDTRNADDPELALCELSTELGCPFTVGEIYEQGQGFLSDMLQGCLGATEPFKSWGDVYEQFLASVEGLE